MVLFVDVLLGVAVIAIIWFACYVVYRLINDES